MSFLGNAGGAIANAFVEVVARTSSAERGIDRLTGDLRQLDRTADRTGESMERSFREVGREAQRSLRGVQTLLATIAGVGVVSGIAKLVSEFSNLEQAVGATEAIFGDARDEIDRFAETSADSVGLAESEFRQLTAVLGGMLTQLGLTGDEAAQISVQLVQIGADLAATFGGTTKDAVDALTAALRGEFDPLERFGILMKQSEVNARAVALGLADTTSNVDTNARALAALSVIQEQSALTAGQFGREADTLQGQLQRLRGEAIDAAAGLGERLAPQVNELFLVAREQLLPALVELGEKALPALADAAVALLPSAVGLVDVLIALTPLLQLASEVIQLIPPELITLATAMYGFNRAARLANTALTTLAVRSPAAALAFGALGGALGVAAIALTAYAILTADARAEQAKLDSQTQAIANTMKDSTSAVEGTAASLHGLIEGGEKLAVNLQEIEGVDVASTLRDLGLSAEEAAELIVQGEDAVRSFLDSASGSREAKAQFALLSHEMQETARQTLENERAAGRLTDQQFEAIEATGNWAAGLDQLASANKREEDQALDTAIAEQRQAAAMAEARAEAELLRETQRTLGDALGLVQFGIGDVAENTVNLALAIDQAKISEEQLALVAQQLGIPIDTLKGKVEAITGVIDGLTSAVQSAMPTLEAELNAVGEDVTFQGIIDAQARVLTATVEFGTNLQLLTENGMLNAARVAVEQGPEFTAALVQPIKDGHIDQVAEFDQMVADTQIAQNDVETVIRNAGPLIAAEMLRTGQISKAEFDRVFHPETPARDRMTLARINIRNAKEGIRSAASSTGSSGASGFRTGVAPLPGHATDAASAARTNIGSGAYDAGYSAGSSMTSGFSAGLNADIIADKAQQIVFSAKAAADKAARSGSPSRLFMEVGSDIGAGLALGIERSDLSVIRATRNIIDGTAREVSSFGGGGDAVGDVFNINLNLSVSGVSAGEARVVGHRIADTASKALMSTMQQRRIAAISRVR